MVLFALGSGTAAASFALSIAELPSKITLPIL